MPQTVIRWRRYHLQLSNAWSTNRLNESKNQTNHEQTYINIKRADRNQSYCCTIDVKVICVRCRKKDTSGCRIRPRLFLRCTAASHASSATALIANRPSPLRLPLSSLCFRCSLVQSPLPTRPLAHASTPPLPRIPIHQLQSALFLNEAKRDSSSDWKSIDDRVPKLLL